MRYQSYQRKIEELFQSLQWGYWTPLSIMARLSEEIGEVAREINHLHGDKRKRWNEPEGDVVEEIVHWFALPTRTGIISIALIGLAHYRRMRPVITHPFHCMPDCTPAPDSLSKRWMFGMERITRLNFFPF
ncbi:MAG: putative pyrophosphatase [Candidatus Wolfebacteria bacterium GW2011_GWE1_48_7]|nr:MAG: putative pyrophosphatase [Candidatus Wolfebacteria bacterium GW2011_GWE1_48_7]